MTFDVSLPGLHGMKGTTDFSKFEPRARRTSTSRVKCLSLPRLLNESKIQHVGYMSVDIEAESKPSSTTLTLNATELTCCRWSVTQRLSASRHGAWSNARAFAAS